MLKILTDQFVVNVLNPRLECGQLFNCFAPFCPRSPLFFPPTRSISVPRWVRWTAPNLEWHKQADQLSELRLSENTKTTLKYTENIEHIYELNAKKSEAGYSQDGGVWESGLRDDGAAGLSVWVFRDHQPGWWRWSGGATEQVLYTLDLTNNPGRGSLCVRFLLFVWNKSLRNQWVTLIDFVLRRFKKQNVCLISVWRVTG